MRKWILTLAAMTLLAAAGAAETPPTDGGAPTGSPAEEQTAADRAAAEDADFVESGSPTGGNDMDFMFPPWILKRDPTTGKGFESAIAYEVASRMGFSE